MSEESNSPQSEENSENEKAASAAAGAGQSAQAQGAAGAAGGESKAGGEDAGDMTPPAAKFEGDISMRRSPWKSAWAALQYVNRAAKTDHVQIRTSDKLTIVALLFFCIAEVLSIVYTPWHGFRFVFMCCCDVILGACVVFFLVYRIGILEALNTRQALICWQMMMGCVFLGIFLCLNTIFAIAALVEAFFPHQLL